MFKLETGAKSSHRNGDLCEDMKEELFLENFIYKYADINELGVPYHDHGTYEIYMLLSGEAEIFVKEQVFLLKENYLLFIPKNIIHRSNYKIPRNLRLVVNFTDDFLPPALADAAQTLFSRHIYLPKDTAFIKKLLFSMGEECKRQDALSCAMLQAHLTELITYCIRHASCHTQAAITNPAVARLLKYINENYKAPITRKDAARMLCISERHLSRIFLENTGFGFKEYLLLIRMKHARQLLCSTKLSIAEIACACGYSDSNYFSKMFHDSNGMPPLTYRRTHTGADI